MTGAADRRKGPRKPASADISAQVYAGSAARDDADGRHPARKPGRPGVARNPRKIGLTGPGRWGSTPPRLLPVLGRADLNQHL